jgi:anti-sigma-K factor RskA
VAKAIDGMLFAAGAGNPRLSTGGLWQSLVFWRGITAAALALLIVAVAVPLLAPRAARRAAGKQFVASIAPKDSDVGYLAYYDPATSSLALSYVSGEREYGHAFELWAIEGQAKPISLGVIPTGKTIRIKISHQIGKLLANGGTLAISLEPPGGLTTGQPTGPVVADGGLNRRFRRFRRLCRLRRLGLCQGSNSWRHPHVRFQEHHPERRQFEGPHYACRGGQGHRPGGDP